MRRRVFALSCLLLALLSGCNQQAAKIEPVDALKVVIKEQGLYRLRRSDLRAAGLPVTALEDGLVQLSEAGQTVPVIVDADGIVFYGRESSSRYTPLRTYILQVGQEGRAMETTAVSPETTRAPLPVIRRTVRIERNLEYVSDAREEGDGQGAGPWFWQTIGLAEPEPITFDLSQVAAGRATVRVRLVGTSLHPNIDPDHNVQMLVNGREAVSFAWDGQESFIGSVDVGTNALKEGANSVEFRSDAQAHLDISKLDWIEVQYEALPRAEEDSLAFYGGPGVLALERLSDVPLVVNVTDPVNPQLLVGVTYANDLATIQLTEAGDYVAAAANGFLSPVSVEPLQTGTWDDRQRQADLLIVTTHELSESLEPLVAARAEENISAVVVPVQEIYDGFGYGARTPQSINRFLAFALANWQKPSPRYLLLVGDATVDYWGFLGNRDGDPVAAPVNQVPSMLVPVHFGGETVSDARLADVDGDYVPDLAVGRWPVDSREAVQDLVERTLRYESAPAPQRAIFAVDASSKEFEGVANTVMSASDFPRSASDVLVGPTADALRESWLKGAWLVTYTGHGSLRLWSDQEMLTTSDVPSLLMPGLQPIVLQLTCLTGLFAHPEITSLSEVMLRGGEGPALIVAATSLTLSAHQELFAAALLTSLQDPSVERVGDALQSARAALDMDNMGLREVNDTFALLGDPSARIVRPD